MKKIFLSILSVLIVLVHIPRAPAHAAGDVMFVPLDGTVGVQMEEFVQQAVRRAEREGSSVLVLQLDTPGGLVEATRGITQAILASQVPVAVWVPPGGRAASAGAFIVQAAHVAAMAPGTNIGAAHPVVASGEDIPNNDMKQKVMNDLRAQMRSIVQLRGRNQQAADRMIDESLSLTAQEALEQGVIDLVAGDAASLLSALSGREVKLDSRTASIQIRPGAQTVAIEMSWSERLIQFVSSPEIAYLLLSGGLLAIFFEVITPGGFILGTAGGVMLLLGAIGLKMLPFSWAGIALLGAGILLMGLDLFLGTSGVLTLLGIPVFCLGGVFLFRAPGGELLNLSLSAVWGMGAALGACSLLFACFAARSLGRRVTTGGQGMVGLPAVAERLIPPGGTGTVRCRGELWRAWAEEGLASGERGIVAGVRGMTLLVRPEREG